MHREHEGASRGCAHFLSGRDIIAISPGLQAIPGRSIAIGYCLVLFRSVENNGLLSLARAPVRLVVHNRGLFSRPADLRWHFCNTENGRIL